MTIPVVFICDDNYAMPTAVTITSLRENADLRNTQYAIYVIAVGVSGRNKDRIMSLTKDGFTVEVIEKALTAKQKEVVQVRERVTNTALMKFELPNVFHQYKKLLYIDSDVLILRDLSPLYETQIENDYVAAVKDVMTYTGTETHLRKIKYPWKNYFNSGVLLLNLSKMRQDQIPGKLLDYRLHGKNTFMDQDALNVVLGEHTYYLSPNYNLLNCFMEWFGTKAMSRFYGVRFPSNKYDAYRQATILHLGDKRKPWKYKMPVLSKMYMEYYKKSPYAAEPLSLEKCKRDKRVFRYRMRYLFKRLW